jgi:hypothetical protein
VKVDLQIPNSSWPESPANTGAKLTDMAGTAGVAGFPSVWLLDHIFQIDVNELLKLPSGYEIEPLKVISSGKVPANAKFGNLNK